jgi:arginyl-tRNA synthetase
VRSRALLAQKYSDKGLHVSDTELALKARVLGNAAVKYFDLRRKRTQDYVFSFDAMLEFNGNTGVYALYTYARATSLLEKVAAARPGEEAVAREEVMDWRPAVEAEAELVGVLLQHRDVLDRVCVLCERESVCLCECTYANVCMCEYV